MQPVGYLSKLDSSRRVRNLYGSERSKDQSASKRFGAVIELEVKNVVSKIMAWVLCLLWSLDLTSCRSASFSNVQLFAKRIRWRKRDSMGKRIARTVSNRLDQNPNDSPRTLPLIDAFPGVPPWIGKTFWLCESFDLHVNLQVRQNRPRHASKRHNAVSSIATFLPHLFAESPQEWSTCVKAKVEMFWMNKMRTTVESTNQMGLFD